MKSQQDFLREIVGKVERAGIPYMLVGSHGSSCYGEPRSTHDVDLVVYPTLEQLVLFVNDLGAAFYVSERAAREAFQCRSLFNIIDSLGAWKADLIFPKDRPYSAESFRRRALRDVGGLQAFVLSPEDSILSKLEWAKKADSERQLRDAASVILGQWGKLDEPYLRRWARELGVEALFDRVWTAAAKACPADPSGG
jgi:hypothetical protein